MSSISAAAETDTIYLCVCVCFCLKSFEWARCLPGILFILKVGVERMKNVCLYIYFFSFKRPIATNYWLPVRVGGHQVAGGFLPILPVPGKREQVEVFFS